MGRKEAYEGPPATVERIDTHASIVFLAGPFAYKVKRAVTYAFLDFSTLEKRLAACRNELRINRRTAPQLYLEVAPITIGGDGRFRLRGEGEAVEYVLVMRRFDQAGLYDRMAEEGRLGLALMAPLARAVAAFHQSADRVLTQDQAVLPLARIIAEHEDMLAANADLFPPAAAEDVMRRTRGAFERLVALLRERARDGSLRHCHGDLHLRNIVEIDGAPVLFDAIEFDDRLATIDVLYDLAFLLMDLGKRGLRAHANLVLNAYLDADGRSDTLVGLATLPLFLSMRAMIRAKVELLRAERVADEAARHNEQIERHDGRLERHDGRLARHNARQYFTLAGAFLAPPGPRLVAIGGLSGSGKSVVSQMLAPELGAFPGAVIVRSDVIRKRLYGMAPEDRLPASAYTQQVSDVVYRICRKRAALALRAGHAVILDAVHAKPQERAAAAALAAEFGIAFNGLWLDAPADVLGARVAKRAGDVSDATPEVVKTQLSYELGEMTFDRIDANLPPDQVAALCLERLAAKP
ncbi:AAA family ATPase [Methyloceanibacter sp.]|uniref:bifunctional aminoglycoside phosphotransferase/ATP-binding protein n=1 Tax=Methyloceanibacter sp. TaxID=1965321 RepID=UPI003D6D72BB